MSKIVFVTYETQPEATPDDALLIPFLKQKNVQVDAIPWKTPGTDWASYDAVILRSCWDYHVYPTEFSNWLDRLERNRCRLWNPVKAVRDNMHKKYLIDLANKGIEIPVTFLFTQGNSVDLAGFLNRHGWDKAVIKPAISAGGVDTWLGTTATIDYDHSELNRLLKEKDMIIQEYSEAIVEAGELSLLFFNGEFSHAVCKRPRSGEFRINSQYKGIIGPTVVDQVHIEIAEHALLMSGVDALYARVDGIIENNAFRLMELELIEPALFFQHAPGSAERFANAIVERIS